MSAPAQHWHLNKQLLFLYSIYIQTATYYKNYLVWRGSFIHFDRFCCCLSTNEASNRAVTVYIHLPLVNLHFYNWNSKWSTQLRIKRREDVETENTTSLIWHFSLRFNPLLWNCQRKKERKPPTFITVIISCLNNRTHFQETSLKIIKKSQTPKIKHHQAF